MSRKRVFQLADQKREREPQRQNKQGGRVDLGGVVIEIKGVVRVGGFELGLGVVGGWAQDEQ